MIHVFRAICHPEPVANDNVPFGVRIEWLHAAAEFIRSRSLKLKRRALRLVR